MKTQKIVYIIFFITTYLCSNLVISQCTLDTTILLTELDNDQPDTTNISLVVTGAVNNDLSASDQGLCGIFLKFKHPFVKELSVELVSPSGQSVMLTGGNIDATNTPFITWDVAFVSCSAAAAPDPGFFDIWDNDQDWQNFNTYTGQYYPFSGCLEDFDMGPVNGTWTLRCIDYEDEGQGRILDASVLFCDDRGISCAPCNLNPGMIENPGFTACSGDDRLHLAITRNSGMVAPVDSNYLFYNTVFSDTSIILHGADTLDLRSFPPGDYTICISQILSSQPEILPSPGTLLNVEQLRNFFFSKGACAALSDSCILITIRNEAVSDTTIRYFCKGTSIAVQDTNIQTPGIYLVKGDGVHCDTIHYMDLRWANSFPDILSTIDSLPCLPEEAFLTVSHDSIIGASYTYEWFRDELLIDGMSNVKSISTFEPGLYSVVVTTSLFNVLCQDTAYFLLRSSGVVPDLSIVVDTITCIQDTIIARALTSGTIASFNWQGAQNAWSGVGDSIRIWKGGFFSVQAVWANGCVSVVSFEVLERSDTTSIALNANDITCSMPFTTIQLVSEFSPENVEWDLPPSVPEPDIGVLSFNSNKEGVYACTIRNMWGCLSRAQVTVLTDTLSPKVDVSSDTITCKQIEVNLEAIALQAGLVYVWTTPSGGILQDAAVTVSEPGLYTLQIENPVNGCVTMINQEVFANLSPPVPIIPEFFILPCAPNRIVLTATAEQDIETHIWTFPDGATSNQSAPEVSIPGPYRIQLTGSNGCTSDPLDFNVIQGTFSGSFSLSIDTISCKNPQAGLVASTVDSFLRFEWALPNGEVIISNEATSFMAGDVRLSVRDSLGCVSDTIFSIMTDTLAPALSLLQQGDFSCLASTVTIKVVQESGSPFSGIWQSADGELLPGNEDFEITALRSGTYSFLATNNQNGCSKNYQITLATFDEVFDEVVIDITPASCLGAADGKIVLRELNGTPPYDIVLGTKDFGNELTLTGLSQGTYFLMITDENGCVLERDVVIEVLPQWTVSLPGEMLIEFGDSVVLTPDFDRVDVAALTLVWKKADEVLCNGCVELMVRPFENTVYNLEYNIDGLCNGKAKVLVRVANNLRFSIPTIFSPGSSGGNNRFFIPRQQGIEKVEYMHVFGPWAENVFSVRDIPPGVPETGWDGTFNGKELNPGVYVVIARLKLSNGEDWLYQGDVMLLR